MQRKIIAGIVIGIVVISVIIGGVFALRQPVTGPGKGGEVAVINISGMITTGGSSSGLMGPAVSGSGDINNQIRKAADNPRIKAVVLRLNSPGGTVAGTQAIAMEVNRLKNSGKKVVASMGDVAASGAYWIASQCDRIVANPSSMTGSIGVIMQVQNVEELYDKLGIEQYTLKKGEYKDMGSSTRDMREDEREILMEMIDEEYEQFVQAIAEGRDMPVDEVRQYATGRIFTGNQALERDLVDETGNFYDAVMLAGKLAGIKGEPSTVNMSPEKGWWELVGNSSIPALDSFHLRLLAEYSPLAIMEGFNKELNMEDIN